MSFEQADFLAGNPPRRFNALFEHTLYCAIQPEMRAAYARAAARWVQPGGTFVATYRDLAASDRTGLQRFIQVHGDDERVMTCFLEYDGPDSVNVHDLVHERRECGGWTLRTGCYRKLRLPAAWLRSRTEAAGLRVVLQRAGPMITLAAVKPC